MQFLMQISNKNVPISSIVFTTIFFIVICVVMIKFMLAVTEWNYKGRGEKHSVEVIVKHKREEIINSRYFIQFETVDKKELEFLVNARQYAMLCEGDKVFLQYKGNKLIKLRVL